MKTEDDIEDDGFITIYPPICTPAAALAACQNEAEAASAGGEVFTEAELHRQRAEEEEQGYISRQPYRLLADFTGADPRFRDQGATITGINTDPVPTPGYPDGNPKTAAGMKKPDLSVVPPVALLHLATAMMSGAEKYGPFNWRDQPISYRPYLAAAMRHLLSCLDGEDFSADTVEAGLPVHHLAHVMACCAIALDAIHLDKINDNRPTVAGPTGEAIERYNTDKRLLG